jgi:tetratricopeptide (TPR) repeat protein
LIFSFVRRPERFGFEATIRKIKLLEQVVARAPAFARAWALIAWSTAFELQGNRARAIAAGLTRHQAVEAAETALRLDPHMGLAYQVLATFEPWAAYRARQQLVERGLATAPNDADVLTRVGNFWTIVGRPEEGLAFGRRAYELDPLAPGAIHGLGLKLYTAGRNEEALRLYDAAYARWPEGEVFARMVMTVAAWQGDRAKVEGPIRDWSAAAEGNSWLQDEIWFARNLLDPDRQSIERYLDEQRAELARTGTVPIHAPWRLHALGLTEEAFELIDKASFAHLFERDGGTPTPGTAQFPGVIFNCTREPFFGDQRFVRLCAKLGLADYWIETGKWPDCADRVAYDFRAEARRLAGAQHAPD